MERELSFYETYVPSRFVLDDGSTVRLRASELEEGLREGRLFKLWLPPDKVDEVARYLLERCGFKRALPSLNKGERYGISRRLSEVWELHLRIYGNGLMEGEVEVSREYFEHLGRSRVSVVYEPFQFYRLIYGKLHILYWPSRKWVVKVLENARVKVKPPKSLTPWKPIMVSLGVLTVMGFTVYALDKLSEGGKF